MCLNVGGRKHWVMSKHFVHFPGTRLGRLTRAKTVKEILEHCDKYFPGKIPEYFFCHDWMGFNSILNVYRNGTLHITSGKWYIIHVHLKKKVKKLLIFLKLRSIMAALRIRIMFCQIEVSENERTMYALSFIPAWSMVCKLLVWGIFCPHAHARLLLRPHLWTLPYTGTSEVMDGNALENTMDIIPEVFLIISPSILFLRLQNQRFFTFLSNTTELSGL